VRGGNKLPKETCEKRKINYGKKESAGVEKKISVVLMGEITPPFEKKQR